MDTQTLLLAAAGATGGGDTDPNFNQTVLLLHGDGSNGAQNNTFLDSSSNNFTITRAGNTTQGSFSPFGRTSGNLDDVYDPAVNGGSAYFDGTGDYLSIADNAALEIGASQFCIEMFVYFDDLPASGAQYTVISKFAGSGNRSWILNVINNSGTMELLFGYTTNGSTVLTLTQVNASGLTADAWHHLAITRDASNDFRYFLNGTQCGSDIAFSATIANTAQAIEIGRHGSGINLTKGYISNVRIVIGSAIYTSTFTPSTSPLTTTSQGASSSEVELLCNFTNSGIFDQTGKNVLETIDGAAISTTTKKYGTGSLSFDGTGDYLKFPITPEYTIGASENFTVECWFYRTSAAALVDLFSLNSAATGFAAVQIQATTGRTITLNVSQTGSAWAINSTSATTHNLNEWNHLAVVRSSGNTFNVYLNGTSIIGPTTNANALYSAGAYNIIGGRTTGAYFVGFIDEFRYTKGVARYTTGFTPPTKAFPDS